MRCGVLRRWVRSARHVYISRGRQHRCLPRRRQVGFCGTRRRRLDGGDGRQRVPVVRRGHLDDVEIRGASRGNRETGGFLLRGLARRDDPGGLAQHLEPRREREDRPAHLIRRSGSTLPYHPQPINRRAAISLGIPKRGHGRSRDPLEELPTIHRFTPIQINSGYQPRGKTIWMPGFVDEFEIPSARSRRWPAALPALSPRAARRRRQRGHGYAKRRIDYGRVRQLRRRTRAVWSAVRAASQLSRSANSAGFDAPPPCAAILSGRLITGYPTAGPPAPTAAVWSGGQQLRGAARTVLEQVGEDQPRPFITNRFEVHSQMLRVERYRPKGGAHQRDRRREYNR